MKTEPIGPGQWSSVVERAAQDWKVEFLPLKVLLLRAAEEEGEMSLVPTQSLTMEYSSADFKSGKPSFYLNTLLEVTVLLAMQILRSSQFSYGSVNLK